MVRIFFILSLFMLCASAAMAQTGDPCAVMPKSNAAVSITSATTTSLVPVSAGKAVYICGVNLTMAAATSIQFEYGTGAACTSPTALSGVIPPSTISTPTMNATQMVTPISQGVCALSVGTAGIHGYVSYVQW